MDVIWGDHKEGLISPHLGQKRKRVGGTTREGGVIKALLKQQPSLGATARSLPSFETTR